jgi:hypothetical protein
MDVSTSVESRGYSPVGYSVSFSARLDLLAARHPVIGNARAITRTSRYSSQVVHEGSIVLDPRLGGRCVPLVGVSGLCLAQSL